MMHRRSFMHRTRGIRAAAALALTFVLSLALGAGGARAVVVEDEGSRFGVALVPGTRSDLASAAISTVTSSGPCTDPALSPDLIPSEFGLCWNGGPVMHANETFALVWDPVRRYFAGTKGYVEQFLRDVADGSGALASPYAVTTQYTDSTGRAANASIYGGACDDFGVVGGFACESLQGSGSGHNYPSGCTPSGTTDTIYVKGSNDYCLTDAQIKGELTSVIEQTGIIGRTEPGYTSTLVLLTPPGVETCLDTAAKLCSAATKSTAPAQFCSYHSRVNLGSAEVDYVVQPWTALATTIVEGKEVSACDEPDVPAPPTTPNEGTLGIELGTRLVSPLSRSQIAAIVNPELNGWFALDGSEIDDNYGCKPLANGLDSVAVGSNSYLLQREFNNASLMELDPYTHPCTDGVVLQPTFVVPSAVNQGDLVQFDGSASPSSLIVPRASYAWDFGDGTTAVGPSVVHSYAKGGTYSVTLTLTDRGGNVRSFTQTIGVLGPNGQVVASPSTAGANGASPGLHVRLQLLPQSLKALLRSGVSLKVTANEAADGIASISVGRAAAKRAHIAAGRGPSVTIGRGTVKGVIAGTVDLHLRLSSKVVAKIGRLRHITLGVSLTLLDRSGDRQVVDAAGRY